MKKTIIAAAIGVLFSSAASAQYTQMQWGVNRNVTPNTLVGQQGGLWYEFAKIQTSGAGYLTTWNYGQLFSTSGDDDTKLTANKNILQVSVADKRNPGAGVFWSPVFINHTINKTTTPAITGFRNTITADLTSDGMPTGSFLNVAQFTAIVNTGAGNAFAFNPYVWAKSGADPTTQLAALESNVRADAPVTYKVGISAIAVATDAYAATGNRDAGLLIAKQNTALGFKNAIQFGVGSGQGAATDNLMYATATGSSYLTALDLHEIAGGFTGGAIVFPKAPAAAFIKWGASGEGGEIKSTATATGPEMIFADDLFAVQFGGVDGLRVAQNSVSIGGCTIGTLLFCVGDFYVESTGYPHVHGSNGDYVLITHGDDTGLRVSHTAVDTRLEATDETSIGTFETMYIAGSTISLRSSSTEVVGIALGATTFTGYIALSEMTAPSAPAANGARLYCDDNGAGKTRCSIIFASGAAQQIAIEP